MTPIKHYQRLMSADTEEDPELVRVLSEIKKQGGLESLADKRGDAQESFRIRESGILYELDGKIYRVKRYEKGEITDQDAAKQKLEQAGAKKVSAYCITEHMEDSKMHYNLDVKLPFDFNEDDVKLFVAYTKEFDTDKTNVAGIRQENGTFKVMEEYLNGEEYKEVEALGMKKDDLLHIRSTVSCEDEYQSEESLQFLDTMINRFIHRLETQPT